MIPYLNQLEQGVFHKYAIAWYTEFLRFRGKNLKYLNNQNDIC